MSASHEVLADREGAYQYILTHFPVGRTAHQQGIVLRRRGQIVAATIYDEFNGTNVFMHIAAEPGRRWLTREFLFACLKYPFNQLGAKRMTAWVEADNADSRHFCDRFGWEHEATLKGAGRYGVDVYLYVLWKEKCKYV